MKLLVDNNLPHRLAEALNVIFVPDHEITALREKFGRANLKDEEWIPKLGAEGGWAVLSADMNIARKRPSRQLFLGAGLVGFFFRPRPLRNRQPKICYSPRPLSLISS